MRKKSEKRSAQEREPALSFLIHLHIWLTFHPLTCFFQNPEEGKKNHREVELKSCKYQITFLKLG